MQSVYHINKGINKPVEFRGLKAHYIWWLGLGLAGLLLLFAVMYICSVNVIFCLLLIAILGVGLFLQVYKFSRMYGEYGMMKKIAKDHIPKIIKCYTKAL